MLRRTFVANSLVAAALSAASASDSKAGSASSTDPTKDSEPATASQAGASASAAGKQRLYYELRRYQLVDGPQKKICDAFFQNAFIPAVNRLGITPVRVFNLTVGPGPPVMYVLFPGASLEALVTLEAHLANDAQYMSAGTPFLSAPAV